MKEKKIDKYYKNNFLYRSHTMMLPEMHEKTIHLCQDCSFFVKIIGKQENKSACIKPIPIYKNKAKGPRPEIDIYEILKHISSKELMHLVETSSAHKTACSEFVKYSGVRSQ
ncbi:MAG: hypothetical protein FH758_14185 [Firmicutes bacterium]|nr:hypothetical protein [Bacillota bacterium]